MCLVAGLGAYPLDGADTLGIRRLEGYRQKQVRSWGAKLPPGALLTSKQIGLHLTAHPELDLDGSRDLALQEALETMLAKRHSSYAAALVDFTDPDHLAVAEVRGERTQVPGSVGKLGILVALFDGLKRAFPDLKKRQELLGYHVIKATQWAVGDHHTIPKFDLVSGKMRYQILKKGERYTLGEWIDHMVSVSANSAASVLWREAMLLRHFGSKYPPTAQDAKAFFSLTPKKELQRLSLAVIEEPLRAVGVKPEEFRQGTMFTPYGRRTVPGTRSFASPLGLARILLRMEQGRLVDTWSSLEMKRFLYVTKRRVRYIFAPELRHAAVYFKSGSMYGCKPEAGFTCKQFEGNRLNLMNAVVEVESPATPGPGQRRYIAVLMSNVLKVNAAWDHSRIAAEIEKAVRERQVAPVEVGVGFEAGTNSAETSGK
jgi:hypothetical protein